MTTCVLLLAGQGFAQSQEPTPRFEIGAHYAFLDVANFGERDKTSGLGARFTYNCNKYIATEAEIDYFPRKDELAFGRAALGTFGVKAGLRQKRFGVFGKARPGFIHFPETPPNVCPLIQSLFGIPCLQLAKTNFAMDVGGVFEYYASRKIGLRFDGGDTIIKHQRILGTTHQLQISAGVVFRF